MFAPLLSDVGASAAAEAAAPWFVTYLLVPILVSLLSAIVGLVGGLMVVRRTAWYQRLTQGDPLAQLLWEKRVSVYMELSFQAHSLAFSLCSLVKSAESQLPQKEFYHALLENVEKLSRRHIEALPILTQAVEESLGSFSQYILTSTDNVYNKPTIPPDLMKKTFSSVKDLLNVMRSDLQVKALERQTTIMLEHVLPLSRKS